MDRNLGALTASPSTDATENARSFGLYYQFGRFSPMPYADAEIYDMYGNVIPEFQNNGVANMKIKRLASDIKEAVTKPYTFFTCSGTIDTEQKWLVTNDYSKNSWNNPNWHTSSTKSLFDPCPPGWCLPGDAVWDNFRSYDVTQGGVGTTRFKAVFDESYPFEEYHGYYFYLNPNNHNSGKTWYPAAGKRDRSTGGMTGVTNSGTDKIKGVYWMTMPASSNFGQCMDMNSDGIQLTANYTDHGGRSAASSVRCIRQ